VPPDALTTVPARGFQYYGVASYWNDFESVRRRLNQRATGDPDETWVQHLHRTRGTFRRALVLNCGNGWVDRDLQWHGLVDEVVGIDIDDALLDAAQRSAVAAGHAATYVRVDINVDQLPSGPFDLVVNHAAGHHIAAIDAVWRQVAERITPDGVFVHWDYVGPHRNQWTARSWERAWEVNRDLPADARQVLVYPHVPTMLHGDPTEAVHSELIVPVLKRYFDLDVERPLGGGVGYLLLTQNPALQLLPPARADDVVSTVMDADERFLAEAPDETLFAFIVATRREPGPSADELARWAVEERDRELAAAADGGRYYPPTMLAELHHGPAGAGQPSAPRRLRTAIAHAMPRVAATYRRGRDMLRRRSSPGNGHGL
jgi:SAM-dependent methyltransferase